MSEPTSKAGTKGAPPKYKRKLSNYLLDKKLQLRYVLLVTILSGIIAGSLGYLINDQRHSASSHIEDDLGELTKSDASLAEFQQQVADDMSAQDHALIYKMVGIGVGLVLILSGYLVIMTHKVAGPLFKTSMYFDRMAEGRLGNVTALRRGDMLQDFFGQFMEMHEAVHARLSDDLAVTERATAALREAVGADAIAAIDAHVARRKQQLHREVWTKKASTATASPLVVVAASAVWVIYGFMGVLGGVRALAFVGGATSIVTILVGVGFLISGIRTATGKSVGVLGIAIASLLFAVLGVLVITYAGVSGVPAWARIVLWVNNGLLAGAGVLAIAGHAKYADWAASRRR